MQCEVQGTCFYRFLKLPSRPTSKLDFAATLPLPFAMEMDMRLSHGEVEMSANLSDKMEGGFTENIWCSRVGKP